MVNRDGNSWGTTSKYRSQSKNGALDLDDLDEIKEFSQTQKKGFPVPKPLRKKLSPLNRAGSPGEKSKENNGQPSRNP